MLNNLIITALMMFLPQGAIAATPDYDQYREKKIFKGKPAAPKLATHKDAPKFQTELRRQSTKGPDFAGHYTIITIGCGTSCTGIAVVDAKTGDVYFPQTLHHVFWAGWWHDPYGPHFKLNSRLFIVYGQADSEDAPYGISYYEWTGGEFKLLHFEAKDRGKPTK